ncbi:MAG: hypothetical protein DWQ05_19145 [Calditrichaeota bacterium]|nr:MAG: hypothetical protein DWQ05_19145 [Calditrichota bacterium]
MKKIFCFLLLPVCFFVGKMQAQHPDDPVEKTSDLAQYLSCSDSLSIQKFIRWHANLDTMIYNYHRDQNSLSFQLAVEKAGFDFNLSPQEKLSRQIDQDYAGSRLHRDQIDGPALLSLSGLTRMGVQALRKNKAGIKKASEVPLPSALDIDILNLIWQKENITGGDIYAGLDSTNILTFIQLRRRLQKMEKIGFLRKKIISPQNPFTFMTPIGDFSFEMSRKNRRNREYAYNSRIDRQDLINYLNAQVYLMSDTPKNTDQKDDEFEALHRLILRLISSSP